MRGSRGGKVDPDRFIELVNRHAAALELYVRQFCDHPEDVVQEAFFDLARVPSPPENPAAWLYGTARRRALAFARSSQRRRRRERAAASAAPAWFESSTEDRIDAGLAQEALRELEIELREPIVLHLWGGLSFAEIAEAMGVSSSAAHRNYHAGLQSLRRRLRLDNEPLEIERRP